MLTTQGGNGGLKMGEDFPMLCETCLGDTKFIRMTKIPSYTACKITQRPFQPFRWRPSRDSPPRETIICYEIAAEKNVCQSCLNDIDYNIPMALRDEFEASQRKRGRAPDLGPKSEINQAFHFNQQVAKRQAGLQGAEMAPSYKLLESASSAEADQSKSDAGKLKLPPLCVSWIKGSCTRSSCNFRPCCGAFTFPEVSDSFPDQIRTLIEELQKSGPRKARVTDRSLQSSLLKSAKEELRLHREKAIEPPLDQSITTLFISNLPAQAGENDVRTALAVFGKLTKVQIMKARACAFAQFNSRIDAENCIRSLGGRLVLHGRQAGMGWAEKKKGDESESTSEQKSELGGEIIDENRETAPQYSLPQSEIEASTAIEEGETDDDEEMQAGLRATPLPYLAPGVPLPFGINKEGSIREPPRGLLEFLKQTYPGFKERPFPKKKEAVQIEAIDWSKYYPSLLPEALEGNVQVPMQ